MYFATLFPIYFIFCYHECRDLMIAFSTCLFQDCYLSAIFYLLLARLHLCHSCDTVLITVEQCLYTAVSNTIMLTSFHVVFLDLIHSDWHTPQEHATGSPGPRPMLPTWMSSQ